MIGSISWSAAGPWPKEQVVHPRFEHRIQVLHDSAAEIDWLTVVVTDKQLLVDIAKGYDRLILGADKWLQIQQVEWYDSAAARDAAMAQLPPAAVVPRSDFTHPPQWALDLNDDTMAEVSSTRARQGELELMAPAARRFATRTGAWIDPDAYERWLDETGNHP